MIEPNSRQTQATSWHPPAITTDPGNAFGNALGNAAIGAINEAEWKAAEPSVKKQADDIIGNIMGGGTDGPRPPAPSAGAVSQGSNPIRLPNKDWAMPDGTVLSLDKTKVVGHVRAVSSAQFKADSGFRKGDHGALPALVSGQAPGSVSYNTPGFDPTAAPDINLRYGVDSKAVNAELARSPISVAELNEAEAHGLRVELVMGGGDYNIDKGVIEIPVSEADHPDQIVSTITHELGHVMWGDVSIPENQALAMGESQYIGQQRLLQLQSEGVATINSVAAEEQIWGVGHGTIQAHVNGTTVLGASEKFGAGYKTFTDSPSTDSLIQGANLIGKFYQGHESPDNDISETYGQRYTRIDTANFASYAADAVHEAAGKMEAAEQRESGLYDKVLQQPNTDRAPYRSARSAREQAVANYEKALAAYEKAHDAAERLKGGKQ